MAQKEGSWTTQIHHEFMTAVTQTPPDLQPPAVSIGLPVYNGENFLREALDSLLGQTFRDFELIVSDNASTDRTGEIVLEYQLSDPRIRYFRQETNIGSGKNFLFVLDEARAERFMWATHDDVWAANWLTVLVANLAPGDIGIRGEIRFLKGRSIVAHKTPPDYNKGNFIRCFLGNENNYRSHYVYSLFDRKKLLAINLDTSKLDYYPDALFTYCLLYQGALRTIPETYLIYRLHDQNLGNNFSRPWKGWKKLLYRIHPFRYYLYYLRYTQSAGIRLLVLALIPIKHIYAQASFWVRGFREIITGRKVI